MKLVNWLSLAITIGSSQCLHIQQKRSFEEIIADAAKNSMQPPTVSVTPQEQKQLKEKIMNKLEKQKRQQNTTATSFLTGQALEKYERQFDSLKSSNKTQKNLVDGEGKFKTRELKFDGNYLKNQTQNKQQGNLNQQQKQSGGKQQMKMKSFEEITADAIKHAMEAQFIRHQQSIKAEFAPKTETILHTNHAQSNGTAEKGVPVVIFGGMGSECSDQSYVNLMKVLNDEYKPQEMVCFPTKTLQGIKAQSEKACEFVKNHEKLKSVPELNVIGVSQGGLVGRSFVEQCNGFQGKVRNLLTVGTPNMGITEIPKAGCQEMRNDPISNALCKAETDAVDKIVWSDLLQKHVSSAGYYRNPEHLDKYKDKSSFLSELNNEKHTDRSDSQKDRLKKLNSFMMVEFDKDEVVTPPASEIFGEFSKKDKGERHIINMEDTQLYKDDFLGLKDLNEKGKLKFSHIDRGHTLYHDEDIKNTFIPFLRS